MLRRLTPLIVLALAVLAVAGGAGAQTAALPSADTPNTPGQVQISFELAHPPVVPEARTQDQLVTLWKNAGAAYGVPWEVLGAINKIESNFGRNMGPSSAGALGWMQFMPSTWERWGLDADGDGIASPWDPDDAVYAAARYLAASGAATDIARAVFSYNHADWYVRQVLDLAGVFSGGGGFEGYDLSGLGFSGPSADAVFQLDDLQEQLTKARRAVVKAQRAFRRGQTVERKADDAVLAAEQQAGDPNLSDVEFQQVEAQVTQLVLEHEATLSKLDELQSAVNEAASRAEELRQAAEGQANIVTFTRPGIAAGIGAPQYSGEYVFPVGGGPSVVSVAHTHHDYPAADIVAPEGSPLYALADGIVLDAYTEPTGRCGVGFRFQIADGHVYVYCHLSYLDARVAAGTTLIAGTPVGLVGQTGHATGPHLHLQFSPTSSYPQDEPWFQSFAGVAFSWSDSATVTETGSAPVARQAPTPAASGPVVTFTQG
jgi:murein DD-endopeptidase MepM/ murein hydrolase activator NlpD